MGLPLCPHFPFRVLHPWGNLRLVRQRLLLRQPPPPPSHHDALLFCRSPELSCRGECGPLLAVRHLPLHRPAGGGNHPGGRQQQEEGGRQGRKMKAGAALLDSMRLCRRFGRDSSTAVGPDAPRRKAGRLGGSPARERPVKERAFNSFQIFPDGMARKEGLLNHLLGK